METEKDALESVFVHVQEKSKSAFLNPSQEIMERHVMLQDKSTIIKPIVTDAPLPELNDIVAPSLEKILVDLYCDSEIFYFYQGGELSPIWENAFSRYTVQRDRLLRYADRRRKKQDVKKACKILKICKLFILSRSLIIFQNLLSVGVTGKNSNHLYADLKVLYRYAQMTVRI